MRQNFKIYASERGRILSKALAVFLLAAACHLGAADLFVAAQTPLLNKAGGKEIAKLHVGAKLQVLKDGKDYVQVRYAGFVPEGSNVSYAKLAVTDDAAKIYDAGENLFKERCGSCNALHGYDEFNVNVWPSVVETMIQNSGLQPDEYETLVRFLQSKAPVE